MGSLLALAEEAERAEERIKNVTRCRPPLSLLSLYSRQIKAVEATRQIPSQPNEEMFFSASPPGMLYQPFIGYKKTPPESEAF